MQKLIDRIPWKLICGLIIGSILIMVGVMHDDGFYKQPIMQVQRVSEQQTTTTTDEFQNADTQTNQTLYGVVLNGKYKGRHLTVPNTYSTSTTMDHDYRVGEKAFVVIHPSENYRATIKDYKRDAPVVALILIAVCLLLVFLKLSGLTALLSIAINTILFVATVLLNGHSQGTQVLWLFALLTGLFSVITLVLILGFTRQMVVTLLSTLLGTAASILIALVAFMMTHERGVSYESMQYVTQLPRPLFLAESMIGSLGAVMDESTDIVSSLFTLKRERPNLSRRQIFLSGRNIGKSIMGPLINVLFFIFMGATIPMALLFLKNGNTWGYSFSMNMSLGVVQSLISGIGIVIAIPLASGLTSLMIEKRGGRVK
ncbi:YibE/F family protein [Nicoliella spurrieriana]|uniref:YibE/F family protein n=1 Tax=Nicoliella spurrieriana TaxID=2925830 RepID=A0A976X4Y2_9LACO|nr:YibE/F family protein [Nicoliella spurrieriana]UQS86249.1 YibE/F family protein [Nicoliella spurrieriana]